MTITTFELPNRPFVFVDVETTDLDPYGRAQILEVALVLCAPDLSEQDHIVRLLQPHQNALEAMPKVVLDMHMDNNLLMDCELNGVIIDEAESDLVAWVDSWELAGQDVPLAGSSVHFDKSFLDRDMRNLMSRFGYRTVDVSTLKELATYWAPDLVYPKKYSKAHRALLDARQSIEELNYYRDNGVLGLAMKS